jgi:hypothetical protein
MSIVADAGVDGVGDANPVRLFSPAPSESQYQHEGVSGTYGTYNQRDAQSL